MKILYVANSPKYFLSHRYSIAKKCISRGDKVYLAGSANDSQDKNAIDFFESEGIECIDCKLSRGKGNILSELVSLIDLLVIIKKIKPDLIHLITLKPVIYGGLTSLLFPKIKVVAAVAGLGTVFISTGIKYRFFRIIVNYILKISLSRKNTITIFQNDYDLKYAVENNWMELDKTRLIRGSGVNVTKYKPTSFPNGEFVVSFVGRLIKDKGIHEYVEAAKKLNDFGYNITMNVYGDVDPYNPSSLTDDEINSFAGIKNLKFNGYETDMLKVYQSSHVICLPSYREGLPKSLIEAGACGRAIITTDVPGCRDAIEDNITGFLVPMNDVKGIVDNVIALYMDRNLLSAMGAAGRERACNVFDIRHVVSNHIEIYDYMISKSD